MAIITEVLLRRYGTQPLQEKFDYDSNNRIIYYGTAPQGNLTSQSTWTINNFTYDGSGNLINKQTAPINSIWDNRTTLTYT